jgi:hypothetical protein
VNISDYPEAALRALAHDVQTSYLPRWVNGEHEGNARYVVFLLSGWCEPAVREAVDGMVASGLTHQAIASMRPGPLDRQLDRYYDDCCEGDGTESFYA